LTPHVQAAYESIAQGATVDVRYRPSSPTVNEEHATDALPEAFHHDLYERREDEFRRGITLVGPHRDDVDLVLNGLPMKGYASHGESWSMALSLRLAAAEVLRGDDVDPIIILDDVFAELDTTRRDHLATMIQGVTQVFITAAVLDDVPAELTGTRFTVTKGQVKAT
ncbi:MAG: DNA replication and repair protein RecF, partial [Rubrivirga sp.]|nr:DNA replication and repair protein RecF [Rubrivirga sp.]